MKRKLRLLFPLLLTTLPLSGCDWITITDANDNKEETVIIDKFYKDYNLKLKGPSLIEELQTMCFDKHTNWITYEQTWSYFAKTGDRNSVDALRDGSEKNEHFYTCAEIVPKVSSPRNFTREHVWPCANSAGLWAHDKPDAGQFSPHYVDYTYYVGGGSDLLHLRPSNSTVNTARGNSQFCDFDDPEYEGYSKDVIESKESGGKYSLKVYGNESFANRSEPDDHVKGDIARIILYVYIHYQERGITPTGSVVKGGKTYNFSDMTGNLSLTKVMGYSTEERCQEKLMEWNEMDPVSDVEKLRNNTVQKIQGNRNPFVDYPDLVNKIFY